MVYLSTWGNVCVQHDVMSVEMVQCPIFFWYVGYNKNMNVKSFYDHIQDIHIYTNCSLSYYDICNFSPYDV